MLRNAVKVWQDVKEFCSLVNGTIKSDVMYVKKRGGRVFLHPGRITEEQHFVNIDSVWSKKRDNIYIALSTFWTPGRVQEVSTTLRGKISYHHFFI